MVKTILLSVDGSVYSDAVLKQGILLAKAFDARIKVISIVDIRFFEWPTVLGDAFVPIITPTVYQEETRKMLEGKTDAVLRKCTKILKEEDIEFETEKIHGPPADVICENAHVADLLIMGARGEFAKWQSKLVGATLEVVVRECNKAILITPQNFSEISKILVAYDGSEKANKGLPLAAYFAGKLKASVSIITVNDNEQVRNKYLKEAEDYLEPYKIKVKLFGVIGNPDKAIVEFAEKHKYDLIVMGSFGHSRIREAILGSTTEQVMRMAKIPLLLAR